MGTAASVALERERQSLEIVVGGGGTDIEASHELSQAKAEISRLRRTLHDQLGAFSNTEYATPIWERINPAVGSKWIHVKDLSHPNYGPPTLFGRNGIKDVSPKDVIQSVKLGNCYFIAALSVLAERPELVLSLFPGREDSAGGDLSVNSSVRVRIFHQNQWRELTLDGWFAVVDNKGGYDSNNESFDNGSSTIGEEAKAKGKDCNFRKYVMYYGRSARQDAMWVSYLEKAYATIYGSYAALSGGDIAEALSDLTGRPVLSIKVDHEPGHLWKHLRNHFSNGQLLACGWCGNDEAAAEYLQGPHAYVFPQHAYAIVDFKTCSYHSGDGRTAIDCYIKLRNPWGHVGNAVKPIPHLTTQVRKVLSLSNESEDEDGTFWLSWTNFANALNCVYVCLLNVGRQVSLNCGISDASHVATFGGKGVLKGQVGRGLNEIVGFWHRKGCGGCSSFSTWRQNPKYKMQVLQEGTVTLTLTQDDMRLMRRHQVINERICSNAQDSASLLLENHLNKANIDSTFDIVAGDEVVFDPLSYHQIGVEVISIQESSDQEAKYHSQHIVAGSYDVVGKTAYWNKRNVTLSFKVRREYVGRELLVIPSTYYPGESGRYFMSLYFLPDINTDILVTQPSVRVEPIMQPQTFECSEINYVNNRQEFPFSDDVHGEWSRKKGTAGGRLSLSSSEFHKNPQWYAELSTYQKKIVSSEEASTLQGKGSHEPDIVKIIIFLRNDLQGSSGGEQSPKIPLTKAQRPGMAVCLFQSSSVPCLRKKKHTSLISLSDQLAEIQYSNALEVAVSLTLQSSDFPILLVPATYMAGQEAPYTLQVLGSHPVHLSEAPKKRPKSFKEKKAKKNGRFSLFGARKRNNQLGNMYSGLE